MTPATRVAVAAPAVVPPSLEPLVDSAELIVVGAALFGLAAAVRKAPKL
jgi:hypothetical protein